MKNTCKHQLSWFIVYTDYSKSGSVIIQIQAQFEPSTHPTAAIEESTIWENIIKLLQISYYI